MMVRCNVCGGVTRAALYPARSDDDPSRFATVPGVECEDCGTVEPDRQRLSKMDPQEVPSAVRMRCGRIWNYGGTVVS